MNERVISKRGWRRRWGLRLAAILLAVAPFVLLELGLRMAGMGATDWSLDPFAALGQVEPLFVLNEEVERYEVGETRRPWFEPESFLAEKPGGQFRVFCVGGSTVQGRPYSTATAFGKWLELSLQEADESKDWRVINAGGVSYASYRLAPIVEEVLEYEPDLIILYTGHNEFLEERTYGTTKALPHWLSKPYSWATRLRTVKVLSDLLSVNKVTGLELKDGGSGGWWPGYRANLPEDVEAALDEYGGLDVYRREPVWRAGVVKHFRYNLLRMVRLAQDRGVQVIVANPVANLRITAPFKSQHADGLSDDDQKRYEALLRSAQKLMEAGGADNEAGGADNEAEAEAIFRAAIAIDDQYALGKYLLGSCLDQLGRLDEAKVYYEEANELDVCPLRAPRAIQAHVKAVAVETGVPLVDIDAAFNDAAPDGLPGAELLIDHVHPTILGHQLIAHHLSLKMLEMGLIYPDLDWEVKRDESFTKHFEGLGADYHQAAQKRLLKLELWARGRASLKKITPE